MERFEFNYKVAGKEPMDYMAELLEKNEKRFELAIMDDEVSKNGLKHSIPEKWKKFREDI